MIPVLQVPSAVRVNDTFPAKIWCKLFFFGRSKAALKVEFLQMRAGRALSVVQMKYFVRITSTDLASPALCNARASWDITRSFFYSYTFIEPRQKPDQTAHNPSLASTGKSIHIIDYIRPMSLQHGRITANFDLFTSYSSFNKVAKFLQKYMPRGNNF